MDYESWFKLKKYPHIGEPIVKKDYIPIKNYVQSDKKISKHSFLPFIHKCLAQRKYRADISVSEKTPSGKRKRIIGKPKIRHIYFANHLDSLIYSYYNQVLSEQYEKFIQDKPFNNSIVAYRKIPLLPGSEKNKCNIDFAKTTFEYIKSNQDKKLTVIIADVTSFFDNLDHKVLKKQWCNILDKSTLPTDHYNVFKSLTRMRYVEGDQLYNSYNSTMIVERGIANSSKEKEYKRIKISSNRFFKEKNAVAYCTKEDFLKNNLNLVISSNVKKGIPQGSPISATLANIYMIDFDEVISTEIKNIRGFYQRYSDDLIVICEQSYEDKIILLLRDKITNLAKLEIHQDKTKIYRFEEINGKFKGFEIDEESKEENHNKTLEYLGFKFDGQRVLIKTSGFSKYYRSMKRSFKKSASLAKNSKNPDSSIFKSRLYKRFTHRGSKRKLIYRPSKNDPAKYEKTKEYYWGNYLSYIMKANDSMLSINGNNIIAKQGRKFWKNFHELMLFHENRIK